MWTVGNWGCCCGVRTVGSVIDVACTAGVVWVVAVAGDNVVVVDVCVSGVALVRVGIVKPWSSRYWVANAALQC